jgi:EAL domain-containing protein (putative c-di-GMP-specific phosphodiesterase class I)
MTEMTGCAGCRNADASAFSIPFTMAFQPIVDLSTARVWGYEALVRGVAGETAGQVLAQVNDTNRYAFDQACRVKAIELAGPGIGASDARLSINFMPNAVYEPKACIRATLEAAGRQRFDTSRLMFEFTENERMADAGHVAHIVSEYRRMGFTTALDDFGAGYAGLNLLAKFHTDLIKIDMDLLRGVDASAAKRAIIRGIVGIAHELGITVLAEGIETREELDVLRGFGIDLFQGYFFARPQVEAFAGWQDLRAAA